MIKHALCFLTFLSFLCTQPLWAQTTISGTVSASDTRQGLADVSVYIEPSFQLVQTDSRGYYQFDVVQDGVYKLTFAPINYQSVTDTLTIKANASIVHNVQLVQLNETLNEVNITANSSNQEVYAIHTHLPSVTFDGIYAAKKNDVINIDKLNANLATNNSRQIFATVAGLNIWESDGGGLQLGIGGRGLSPNRTSNFNTRQNGYDISADALGYPESYYTPPTEALQRIELIRGAASLQYGTQFGGMLNFVFKDGASDKRLAITSRQTTGSWGLFSSFNSIGGTLKVAKGLQYYSFFQHKRGNGWRPNSGFSVNTAHAGAKLQVNSRLKLGLEYTLMQYQAQQAGGLSDALFDQNPQQSVRERNWFKVHWQLGAFTSDYDFSSRTHLNNRTFALLAKKDALGFLGVITRADPLTERDLLADTFKNIGHESRLMHKYYIGDNPATLLVGARVYQGKSTKKQGLGNNSYDPDFVYLNPDNLEKSDYTFPSFNGALFVENLFNISPKLSITPGFRLEYIKTAAAGYYRKTVKDFAGNIIEDISLEESKDRTRYLHLFGLGIGYRPSTNVEIYGNFSQNFRGINFTDFRVQNPNFTIDTLIRDEYGYNADLGIRGSNKSGLITFDATLFCLNYSDKIGSVWQYDSSKAQNTRVRKNIADARNLGIESLVQADVWKLLAGKDSRNSLSVFSNLALINARYLNSENTAINNKQVELVPPITFKTGFTFSRAKWQISYQYAYTQQHYTDATNAPFSPTAVSGIIPSYYVMDLSASYRHTWWQLEGGINNLSNNHYFTRRAVAYPGPGIIPSDARSFYLTLGIKI